ncbi:PKS_AT domain-containing protein, partial [Meloidogyne graminicola]
YINIFIILFFLFLIPSIIYSIGEVQLNNNNSIAIGNINIFNNNNNNLISIEGIIAKRFEKNKINKNYLKENKQNNNIPLFNKEATKFRLFPLSAESKNSLKFFALKLVEFIKEENPNIDQLSNYLLFKQKHFICFRKIILAKDLNELNKELLKIINNEEEIIENNKNKKINLAVFFGPQGVQFPGMFLKERQLFPLLNNKIINICKQLEINKENKDQLINLILNEKEELFSKNILFSNSIIQCSIFVIYQSIWQFLLKIFNFKINLFFGHSFGEICALCSAKYFNINKGINLLWKRGELIEKGTKQTKMLLIEQKEIEKNENLHFPPQIYLSARLSSSIFVLVGIPSHIEFYFNKIIKEEKNQKIKSAKILEKINYGYHSNEFMGPIIKDFKFFMNQIFNKNIKYLNNNKIIISNLDGNILQKSSLDLVEYLGKQLSKPVRLDLCLKTLINKNIQILLEIGPSNILPKLINEIENELGIKLNKRIKIIKIMENKLKEEEEEEEPPQILKAISQLWEYGFSITFNLLFNSINNNQLNDKIFNNLLIKEEIINKKIKTTKLNKKELNNNLLFNYSSSIFLPLKNFTNLNKNNNKILNIFCIHPIS